jgi:hypothetical protein
VLGMLGVYPMAMLILPRLHPPVLELGETEVTVLDSGSYVFMRTQEPPGVLSRVDLILPDKRAISFMKQGSEWRLVTTYSSVLVVLPKGPCTLQSADTIDLNGTPTSLLD